MKILEQFPHSQTLKIIKHNYVIITIGVCIGGTS